MSKYDRFFDVQEAKYAGIRAAGIKTRSTGLRHDPALQKRNGCVSIALSHPLAIEQGIADFSRLIAGVVPALVYEAKDLHTTLCSGRTEENFFPRARAGLIEELGDLARVVASTLRLISAGSIEITYTRYLHNDSVVIAAGEPNNAYVDLVGHIAGFAEGLEVIVYPAIDAHITVSRFTQSVGPEQLGNFFSLMEQEGPGVSVPDKLHVGYSYWDAESPYTTNGHFVRFHSFSITSP
ncbi:MAG: hypothetical protein Q7S26_03625 [bacterium]|nr:hypothetical protein [bacterium]